jgi:hypothetical protein
MSNLNTFKNLTELVREVINEYGEDSGGQDMTWGMYSRDNYVPKPLSSNGYDVAKAIKDELPDIIHENIVEKKVEEYFLENDLNQKRLQQDDFWEDLYYALTEDFGKKYGNGSSGLDEYDTSTNDAPFNQGDNFEYDDFEIINDSDSFDEFKIKLFDTGGGETVVTLHQLLVSTNAPIEDEQYFANALESNQKPPSFMKKLEYLIDDYIPNAEFSNHPTRDDSMEYDPTDY